MAHSCLQMEVPRLSQKIIWVVSLSTYIANTDRCICGVPLVVQCVCECVVGVHECVQQMRLYIRTNVSLLMCVHCVVYSTHMQYCKDCMHHTVLHQRVTLGCVLSHLQDCLLCTAEHIYSFKMCMQVLHVRMVTIGYYCMMFIVYCSL